MKKHINTIVLVLFIIYMCALLRITVFRSGFSVENLCQNGKTNFELFDNLIMIWNNGAIRTFFYYLGGNIIWFIPFGSYLAYALPKCNMFFISLMGLMLSLVIEVSQYVFGVGVSEIDDLILNTLGVFIGAGIVRLFTPRKKRKARGRR